MLYRQANGEYIIEKEKKAHFTYTVAQFALALILIVVGGLLFGGIYVLVFIVALLPTGLYDLLTANC